MSWSPLRLCSLLWLSAAVAVGCRGTYDTEAAPHAIKGGGPRATAYPDACLLNRGDGEGICSASLLAPTVALTAAHCVYKEPRLQVICPYSADPAVVRVVEVASAPSYPKREPEFIYSDEGADLALLRLDRPVKETRFRKVGLGEPVQGAQLVSIGRVNDGQFSERDLFVSRPMKVSTWDVQHHYWLTVDYAIGQPGDSGGPLLWRDQDAIIGVESGGHEGCTRPPCEVFGLLAGEAAWVRRTFQRFAGRALDELQAQPGGDGGPSAGDGALADGAAADAGAADTVPGADAHDDGGMVSPGTGGAGATATGGASGDQSDGGVATGTGGDQSVRGGAPGTGGAPSNYEGTEVPGKADAGAGGTGGGMGAPARASGNQPRSRESAGSCSAAGTPGGSPAGFLMLVVATVLVRLRSLRSRCR